MAARPIVVTAVSQWLGINRPTKGNASGQGGMGDPEPYWARPNNSLLVLCPQSICLNNPPFDFAPNAFSRKWIS
jgi:hypothetical protein